ncbi:hexosyltransferase [Caerostris extrusa]|uniref:Hexosyltransferase n=1 Tax=Caerostris extrusa TaxID=172846 RepID=A0AAV4XY52_CAEEX|nr:hexosyltransferase [Caerostris extrusa]
MPPIDSCAPFFHLPASDATFINTESASSSVEDPEPVESGIRCVRSSPYDDVFVNVYALRDLLEDLRDRSEEKKFWCLVWEGMPVIRTNHSKWYLSKEKYGEDLFPHYCSGSAYIFNSVVLEAILGLSNRTLPLESAEDCSRDRDARA